jgi:hypothetical protein
MYRTVRTWSGNTLYKVRGRVVRDTGTGIVVEDERGIRYYAKMRDVLETEDLFGEL